MRQARCIEWSGARNGVGPTGGYGVFGRGGQGRRLTYAHRWAYALFHGAIPEGMCVLHHCDNPPCINPDHLFLGTKGDNNRDKTAKGRHHYTQRTHCKSGHEYPPGAWHKDRRRCKVCERTWRANSRARARNVGRYAA